MPQDNIEEIKAKIDVVELLQEYIQLRPAGANNFKALCPFHHEKTPSFMVSRDKQIWHCFGCGEGGDIFGFIMKMEGLEFPEALRILAKKAGVQLKYQDPAVSSQKTKILDICKAAASFYHKILLDHPKAQIARDYLVKRRLKPETVSEWQLGYAPEAWDVLNKYLVQKGFKEEDIFAAGLTVKKERGVGYNDRFHHRLMFPINDAHGNIIGFGGRFLGEGKDVAKYINSPQTLVYNKSYVVFGLDKAKQAIKEQKVAVIVEGYMDCLTSHQAGVTNVVASSGTALTSEQVKLLKRFTTNLAFAFDQDLAGDSASKRGIEVAWQQEMNTKIILISGAKDPDELINKDPQVWRQVIKGAKSIMDYYFTTTLGKINPKNVDDKKRAAKTLLTVIARLADTVEQTHYIQKLSAELNVPEDILMDKLRQILKKETARGAKEEETAMPQKNRFVSLAESIIGMALLFPDDLNYIIGQLAPEQLPVVKLQKLYKSLIIHYTEKQVFDYNSFIKSLPQDDSDLVNYAEILSLKAKHDFEELDEEMAHHEIINGVKELKKHALQELLKDIESKLRQAETAGDRQKIEEYSLQFSDLMAELAQMK